MPRPFVDTAHLRTSWDCLFFLFCSCVFDVFFFVFEFWLHLGNAYRKRTRFHRFGQSFYRIAHAHPKATERPRNLKLLPPTPPTPAREKIEEILLEKFKETDTICPKSWKQMLGILRPKNVVKQIGELSGRASIYVGGFDLGKFDCNISKQNMKNKWGDRVNKKEEF